MKREQYLLVTPNNAMKASTAHYLLFTCIVTAAIAALYPLSLRFAAQLEVLAAKNRMLEERYLDAASLLERAVNRTPSDPDIWKRLARAYHEMVPGKPPDEGFQFILKARRAYAAAARLNPLDAESRFGVAVETSRLERLLGSAAGPGGSGIYNALPDFEETLRLRPNGIRYQYEFARHLYWKQDGERLLGVVENLTRTYPPVYGQLKREPFWSPEVRQAARRGLERAAGEGIVPGSAHAALAALLAEEKDWEGVIGHYREFLAHGPESGSPDSLLQLGKLYLRNGQKGDAEAVFLKALSMGGDPASVLEKIYQVYASRGAPDAFEAFCRAAGARIVLPRNAELLRARALMAMHRYAEAKEMLEDLNRSRPDAEAYYLLYRIAELEKDSRAMEAALMNAIVLDPRNGEYHRVLSRLLLGSNDLEGAEREAGRAIRYAARPDVNLYAFRAGVRSQRGDHAGAAEDWEAASRMQPGNAGFHANAGNACEAMGDLAGAREKYRMAAELHPDNRAYRDRLRALGGTGSE